MYCAVITDRGLAWLADAENTPLQQAVIALVAPQLEAAHPRALFDAFCARLHERWEVPQTTDGYRSLWRAMRDDGLIAVRGSLQVDAGRAFAFTVPFGEDTEPRLDQTGERKRPSSHHAAASTIQDVPLIPRQVSDWSRAILDRLHSALDAV